MNPFEKRELKEATSGYIDNLQNRKLEGYNECLDSTNAKAIYEKAIRACKEFELYDTNKIHIIELSEKIKELKQELDKVKL